MPLFGPPVNKVSRVEGEVEIPEDRKEKIEEEGEEGELDRAEAEEPGAEEMKWAPMRVQPVVEEEGQEGNAVVREVMEEHPFWLNPGTPPRAEHKVTLSTQTQLWVIGEEEEEVEEEEEDPPEEEEAPEGGQLPPDFLAEIVNRLTGALRQNLRLDEEFLNKMQTTLEKVRTDGRSERIRITDSEKRRERRREIAIVIKGKAAVQNNDREGEREAIIFLGRHYRRQVMERQRVGQNRCDKIFKRCREQGREATGADLEEEFGSVEEDDEMPPPDEVIDTLDWTWLDYWKKNKGRFELSLVFPELSRQELEELEKELLEGKEDNVRKSSRRTWDVWGDIPPGKAPWDRNQEDPEGGAGGSHPVGVYMMRESRDRSRSRSGSEGDEQEGSRQHYRSPDEAEEGEEAEDGEEEKTSTDETRYWRQYRNRIGGFNRLFPTRNLGPFGTLEAKERIGRWNQRQAGRQGTGLPNRWLYQCRPNPIP